MMTAESKVSAAAPIETRPLLPTWIAYAAAGLTFVAAAYLWTAVPAFLALYQELGIELPLLVVLQVSYPRVLPLVMIAVGGLVLLATRLRIPAAVQWRSARLLAALASVGLVLFSVLMVVANAIAVREMQRAEMNSGGTIDQVVQQKLAWAKSLPNRARVASRSGLVRLPGKGEPLAEALASLAKQANVRIRLAPEVPNRESWTDLKDVGWRTALTALTRNTGLQMYWVADDDLILVPANTRAAVCPETVSFKEARLGDVVKRLRVGAGFGPTTCDPSLADRRVTVQFVEAPQHEVLSVLAVLTNTRVQTDPKTGASRFVPPPK